MIVSHEYMFIFIKTGKTAGSSVEADLNKYLGDRDIATSIYPPEPEHTPKNNFYNGKEINSHSSALQVREIVGSDIFERYLKFCVEREPVDKCISHWQMKRNSPYHNNNGKYKRTWDRYVEQGNYPEDSKKYLDEDGKILVDRILYYENLQQELRGLLLSLGLPWEGLKSKAKSGFRKEFSVEDVSDEHKNRIYEAFQKSLKYTGYNII